jgi:colanic acid/amylovoran biosynthesis glycosyltransferase
MRVGYLASHYPAVSHTFVLREIHALRKLGVEVETFSIHRTPTDQLLADADREEAARTYTVLPVRALDFAASHLAAFARSPSSYLSTLGLAVRRANPGLRGRLWGLFYFAEAMPIWRAAKRRRIHHLHAVFGDVASDVALLVTRYAGNDWTWSMAIHGPDEFSDVRGANLADKLAAARFVIAISDFGRSQLMTVSDEERWDDIHVVRCGLDPKAFPVEEHAEHPRAADTDNAHIVCVGRLIHVKGQALLIQAVAELRERGLEARLTLVGAGPERANLEQLGSRLRISEHIVFAGAVGQDHIQSIYRSADVFCLPSLAEGLPVVFMEAMALRIPVVASRIMGVPELVEHGRTGLLVTPARLDLLVDALARVLADPALRERLAGEARKKVLAEFDVNASAAKLREIFAVSLANTSRAQA